MSHGGVRHDPVLYNVRRAMPPTGYLPKLRPLDIKRVVNDGQGFFVLRDTLGLADGVVVPEALGPLLALCDGTRQVGEIATGFQLRTGFPLSEARVGELIESLAEALVFEDERFDAAYHEAKMAYRNAPHRPPALAGKVYPEDPDELALAFGEYCRSAGGPDPDAGAATVGGIVSPHIDYQRGWRVYAEVWQRAASAIVEADIVIVFGTDHSGGPGKLTLTRQDYATPWGVLPTAQPVVEAMAQALGEEEAFAEELHHRNEHSIELALTWLHFFLRPRECAVVPVLCGSFHEFVDGVEHPDAHEGIAGALDALRSATRGRRVLVVAAADLAHVGPVFGDAEPWAESHRETLRSVDASLLEAIADGDHKRFFHEIRGVEDRNRVCGMPPIYLTLRLLEGATGSPAGYEQCPADAEEASFVSIAGAVLSRNT